MAGDRNINPHAEALMAMIVYGNRYARQTGGSMDFWDTLTRWEKESCRIWVNNIIDAWRAKEPPHETP